jgi:hypothetical protein
MTPPKVLVGCPVSDHHSYCTGDYLKAVTSLSYPNYDILLVDNSASEEFSKQLKAADVPFVRDCYEVIDVKDKIAASRNVLRKKVLEGSYDYFLSLEQDVIPPKDIIETLLQHKKPIVSGVYFSYYPVLGKQRLFPVLYRWLTDKEQEEMKGKKDVLEKINPGLYKDLEKNQFDFSIVRVKLKPEDVVQPRLLKVKQCGVGCVLLAKEVLEQVEFRIDHSTDGFDDATFCDDALEKGYDLYADTSVKCQHLLKGRPWTWEKMEKK